jgi:hypothetical protein
MLYLKQFKTVEEVEKEWNRIILLCRKFEKSHVEGDEELDALWDYAVESKILSPADIDGYMKRKNCHRDGRPRTHLEFALNLNFGQKDEHNAFLYFIDWLKNKREDDIRWELNGSDMDGYVFLSTKSKKIFEPDYRVFIGEKSRLVESKSFHVQPTLKIVNLKKYKKRKAVIVLYSFGKHYLIKKGAINYLLEKEIVIWSGYDSVELTSSDISELLEQKHMEEIINA